ncbi:transcriptional repressor LexA [Lichenicoccus roseus]|uniref:LexA repressor n=1 Tax=Lichenicoccus roseus TaxID=2683649 RepID=A0A5R9JA84_9PROT|nr:transcriptional repressor LexA [Lichenicoccus roseus]TLU73909.1 transcriptional repressor LexA [Lichenicoccus roseus]
MLTRKQHELLGFIDRHLKETGFSPSFDEMKDALNLRSKSGIHRLISALEERGFLSRRHHRARALEVLRLPEQPGTAAEAVGLTVPEPVAAGPVGVGPVAAETGATEAGAFSPNVIRGDFSQRLPGVRAAADAGAVQLPLYGRIAAGLPIEALRDTGNHVQVPMSLLGGGEHYALEVAGDSMIEAGIFDGDTVIIRKEETAENGQIIVALIDDQEVTLKRLRRRGNAIALEPANARYETRIVPVDRVRVQGRLVGLMRRY